MAKTQTQRWLGKQGERDNCRTQQLTFNELIHEKHSAQWLMCNGGFINVSGFCSYYCYL